MTSVTGSAFRGVASRTNRTHLWRFLHEQLQHEQLEDKQIRRNPKPNVQSVAILCKMGWLGKEENQGKTAPHRACATWEPDWQPRTAGS